MRNGWGRRVGIALILIGFNLGSSARAQPHLDSLQQQRVIQIVNVFENENIVSQYQYVKNLKDGRGYTAGRSGFTTATGDLLEVVEAYLKKVPSSSWSLLLPTLRDRARRSSDSVVGLEMLPLFWVLSSHDPLFRQAQDQVEKNLYEIPAAEWCETLSLRTPLAYLIIYDTAIQNGTGSDPDGLVSIIKNAKREGKSESEFLVQFLEVRYQVLMNPFDPKTAKAWRESVGRVKVLKALLKEGNSELKGPIKINPYGNSFVIR